MGSVGTGIVRRGTLAALAALAIWTPAAQAAAPLTNGLVNPEGVGINATTGEVYVADQANNRIQRFAANGDRAGAATAYDEALALYPGYAPALAAQGRLAVASGDLDTARERFAAAAAVVPLPEYVIALGEIAESAGDTIKARRQYDLARAEKEFDSRHYREARLLYEQAHQTDRSVTEACRERWAYCRLSCVVEQMNQNPADMSAIRPNTTSTNSADVR